jgi:hypothetical protein
MTRPREILFMPAPGIPLDEIFAAANSLREAGLERHHLKLPNP